MLENYATRIGLNFGHEVTPIDFDAGDGVVVQLTKCRDDSDDEDAREVRVNPISTTVEALNEQDTSCDPEPSRPTAHPSSLDCGATCTRTRLLTI